MFLINPYRFATWASNWLLNNLVSYYKCDTNGSFPDAHWSNDWTISWATYTASWKINWWYSFDWTNDYISIPDNAWLRPWTWDFARSIWINTTATATKIAMSKGQISSWSWDYVSIITYDTWVVWFRLSDWTTLVEPKSTTLINDWNWHHIVWYRSWTTAYLYVDNVLEQSLWSAWYNLDNTAPLVIGNFSYLNASLYFSWIQDEIWIWNSWLDATKISDIYNWWAWLSYDNFTT